VTLEAVLQGRGQSRSSLAARKGCLELAELQERSLARRTAPEVRFEVGALVRGELAVDVGGKHLEAP
jgi:hypothetical protein